MNCRQKQFIFPVFFGWIQPGKSAMCPLFFRVALSITQKGAWEIMAIHLFFGGIFRGDIHGKPCIFQMSLLFEGVKCTQTRHLFCNNGVKHGRHFVKEEWKLCLPHGQLSMAPLYTVDVSTIILVWVKTWWKKHSKRLTYRNHTHMFPLC